MFALSTFTAMRREREILLCLTIWRLLSVLVVQTFHVPDEYWQSLEVAHRLAFGYGYSTWEWRVGIRGYTYPFLVSLLYRSLTSLRLDHPIVLVTAPRLFQAMLSAYADYRFYVWTGNRWALFALCTNWYWYYCACRTLVNSVETALTTIALSVFPWKDRPADSDAYLWIVGIACIARPTAAIVWTPLCLYRLIATSRRKAPLIVRYSIVVSVCLSLSTIIDTICYGRIVISPLEFFRVNVLGNVATGYGTHSAAWYLTSGLPVLLGLHYLAFLKSAGNVLASLSRSRREDVVGIAVICWTVAIYSLLEHKEFRFLLPLLPVFLRIATRTTRGIAGSPGNLFIILLLVSNLIPGLYFSLIHRRGSLDAMKVLREEVAKVGTAEGSLLFLTPCHATPLYSHLHANVTARFLTCEPNLKGANDYVDEADRFFSGPAEWLDRNYPRGKEIPLPGFLILFDNLAPRIATFLRNYKPIAKIFDSHFPENNYGEYLIVYKRKAPR